MKTIPLTKGKAAFVDDADYDWLNQWKWCASRCGKAWYAQRRGSNAEGKVYMHVQILGKKPGFHVDHVNCNTLDNQRGNLRHANRTQSSINRRPYGRLGVRGVCEHHGRYDARIGLNYGKQHLGLFATIGEAAAAYDAAALKLHGEFAVLNNLQEEALCR